MNDDFTQNLLASICHSKYEIRGLLDHRARTHLN